MSEWNGARWWKCDLHSHTPASHDYRDDPGKVITPREWLLGYMRVGIDCVAITDHNSGEWINRVKTEYNELQSEKPEGYRPLCLFPGVEISVHGGIHLLAILGSDKTSSDVDSLLGAVEFPPSSKGSSDAVTKESFVKVVEAIVDANGIAIPAHADLPNGVFEQTGMTLKQILDCNDIFAVELVDPEYERPQLYQDKGLQWTGIIGSDSHHLPGGPDGRDPGSHFTWIKMGSPCIEGLRLALLDGDLSVRRIDEYSEDPNKHSSLTLESIEVCQGRYMGRSRPFTISFNPWFNAIIGGRGTGKSTSVEFLRIALRRISELPPELQVEFEQYGEAYKDREDSGLLTNEATLRVIYKKDNERFRVQWNPAGDLAPIEREENTHWELAEGEVKQRFPVRIYSQKQVFHLAKSPDALLKIINEAPGVEFRAWSEEWNQEETRFLSLKAKAREIEVGLVEEQRLLGELDDVKRKLQIFEQSGHAEILKSFQKRSRQQRDVHLWEQEWANVGDWLREQASEILPDHLSETSFETDVEGDNDLQKLAAVARSRLDKIRASIEALASQADDIVSEWKKDRDASTWKQCVEAAVSAYEQLKENLDRQGAGDPAAYGELVQQRQVIEQRLNILDENKKQVTDLKSQADDSLKRLLNVRHKLTEARQKFLKRVLRNNKYVRISIDPYGARDTVERKFRQLIQKEDGSFANDIGSPDGVGLLGELYEAQDIETFERKLNDLKTLIVGIANGEFQTASLADQRFSTHLSKLQPEALDRLESWFPEDSLQVQYSAAGDGSKFRSIEEGSPGQKTAALLAFLLSYGDEPLILDQPEDDLDNYLIYDLIVTQLREVKLSRQVLVVTHNANIVVNGDAELVVAMAARGGETHKECEGSLQDQQVRDTICSIMEGGRRAFEDRYRRIALEGRHV